MNGTIEVELGGQILRVEYGYSPGRPGKMYLWNGDPGYPDEPEEFYVEGVKLIPAFGPGQGWPIDITSLVECLDPEWEALDKLIQERAAEQLQVDADEAACARWEQQQEDNEERGWP